MTNYTVSHAGPNAADMPCRLHRVTADLRDQGRCGQSVRFVVDEWDLDETPRRHVIQFGACDEHADLYR